MRLPAPGPILKLNQQSNIRRPAGLSHIFTADLPPCNFAVVPADFPRSRAGLEKSGYPSRPVVPPPTGGDGIFAAPSWL